MIALGALVAMAGVGQLVTPASAEIDYPYCRDRGGGEYNMRCDFTTLEQCQATASGLGGSCSLNPFYHGSNANANASYRGRARRAN
jgi:hypothetical protein